MPPHTIFCGEASRFQVDNTLYKRILWKLSRNMLRALDVRYPLAWVCAGSHSGSGPAPPWCWGTSRPRPGGTPAGRAAASKAGYLISSFWYSQKWMHYNAMLHTSNQLFVVFVDLADIIITIKIETLGQLCHVVSVAIVLSTFKEWWKEESIKQ